MSDPEGADADGAGPAAGRPFAVRRAGERALLVECAEPGQVLALHAELLARPLPGQTQVVAAARTVLVELRSAAAATRAARVLTGRQVAPTTHPPGRLVQVPTVYDGPDLPAVAAALGMSAEAVVAAHGAADWDAAFTGFAPGFVYLVRDDAPEVPRREVPRPLVPARSVALGGRYSAVYPRDSPGGWQLIGRTDVVLWDVAAPHPALIRPGDRVRFTPSRPRAVRLRGDPDASPRERSGPPGRTGLVVVDAGLLTLVQDLGRPGLADLGVTRSGAADRTAARSANRLVGNERGAGVLETVGGGLHVRAQGDVVVAVTGAARTVHTTGGPVRAGRPFALRDGQELTVPAPPAGLRTYLAVRGGADLPPVLGSRSRDVLAALGPPPLTAGDVVPVGAQAAGPVGTPEPGPVPSTDLTARVVLGPRSDVLARDGVQALCRTAWRVSAMSNRVGLRLEGPPLRHRPDSGLPSEGVVRGAVQLPPSGVPVVFGPDHPVTGGYPVIAVVVDADQDALAQLRPGDVLRFERWTEPVPSRMLDGTEPGLARPQTRGERP